MLSHFYNEKALKNCRNVGPLEVAGIEIKAFDAPIEKLARV